MLEHQKQPFARLRSALHKLQTITLFVLGFSFVIIVTDNHKHLWYTLILQVAIALGYQRGRWKQYVKSRHARADLIVLLLVNVLFQGYFYTCWLKGVDSGLLKIIKIFNVSVYLLYIHFRLRRYQLTIRATLLLFLLLPPFSHSIVDWHHFASSVFFWQIAILGFGLVSTIQLHKIRITRSEQIFVILAAVYYLSGFISLFLADAHSDMLFRQFYFPILFLVSLVFAKIMASKKAALVVLWSLASVAVLMATLFLYNRITLASVHFMLVNTNHYAMLFGLSIFVTLYLMRTSQSRTQTVFLTAVLLVLLCAAWFSNSSGLIAALTGSVLVLAAAWVSWRVMNKESLVAIQTLVLILLVPGMVLYFVQPYVHDLNTLYRISLWKLVAGYLQSAPGALAIGTGEYHSFYLFRVAGVNIDLIRDSITGNSIWIRTDPHNDYLHTIYSAGVPAFLFFLGLLYLGLRAVPRDHHSKGFAVAKLALLMVAIHSYVEITSNRLIVAGIFWFVLGWNLALERPLRRTTRLSEVLGARLTGLLAVSCAFLMQILVLYITACSIPVIEARKSFGTWWPAIFNAGTIDPGREQSQQRTMQLLDFALLMNPANDNLQWVFADLNLQLLKAGLPANESEIVDHLCAAITWKPDPFYYFTLWEYQRWKGHSPDTRVCSAIQLPVKSFDDPYGLEKFYRSSLAAPSSLRKSK
ncbi:MAG: hypothetical protein KDK39_14580 [Leptospiraceae bacterium]|nr:hypothetical protein [Leptospiraceae bacterium]